MSKSKLKVAQEKAEDAVKETNKRIEALGTHTSKLYENLSEIQDLFDVIRNVPGDTKLQYEKLKKMRVNWKQQAEKIESDYKIATAKNAGAGAAGLGAGVAVAALGPTAAMGIATTFGVASTGTAISALSGAAATNAALAWLGGGALVAGGGGMAAGDALLALAGPVGWAIAGVAFIGSGFLFWKNKRDKDRLEDIFTQIGKRDVKSHDLAIRELNERIRRIDDATLKLNEVIEKISTFELDYEKMTEAQQYELGAYVNLMHASTQLLVNPIMGLRPKYNEEDFKKYKIAKSKCGLGEKKRELIIYLANLLCEIEIKDTDKKPLWKYFKNDEKFLTAMKLSKKDFFDIIEMVEDALKYKDWLEMVSV